MVYIVLCGRSMSGVVNARWLVFVAKMLLDGEELRPHGTEGFFLKSIVVRHFS